MSLNYNAIEALTKKKYIPKLIDNIFKTNPVLMLLKDRQKSYDGGLKIVEPLIYGNLGGINSFSMYDTVQYDTDLPISAAEFEAKNYVGGLIISKDEELRNNGESQVLDMVDSKMKILEKSLQARFSTDIYADGTGNSGKNLTGLAAAVADSGTYGTIDRGTYAWWKAKVSANSGTPRDLTLAMMAQMFMSLSDGDDTPDLIVCPPGVWLKYHDLVKGQIQVQSAVGKKLADYGFQTLEFMGVPLVADLNCTAGTMFFLNLKYAQLRVHKDANFAVTPFRRDDTRLAMKKEIIWNGNFTINNCRRFGVIKDLNAVTLL